MNNSSWIIVVFSLFLMSCGTGRKTVTQKNTPAPEKTEEVKEVIPTPPPPPPVPVEEKIIDTIKEVKDKVEETTKKPVEAFNHSSWNQLLQKHVSATGKVNYKGFIQDRTALKIYLDELANNLPQESWTKEDKLAYWINVYNAYTVKLIINNYPTKSIKDIKDPWGQRFFKLGKKWYNLNDVEHQILRKMNEPRIHFAIVCASVSCPNLKNNAFNAIDLEEQLTDATKSFLSDPTKNTIAQNSLKLSKIFKWFTKDFKQNNGSLISFINQYTDQEISANTNISYRNYDWNLNE